MGALITSIIGLFANKSGSDKQSKAYRGAMINEEISAIQLQSDIASYMVVVAPLLVLLVGYIIYTKNK